MSKAPFRRPSETVAPVPSPHRKRRRRHVHQHVQPDPHPLEHGSREAIVREDKEIPPKFTR